MAGIEKRAGADPKARLPRTRRRLWVVLAVLVAVSAPAVASGVPGLRGLGILTLVAIALSLAAWLLVIGARRLLWSVGRRLTVSYLLIGVLPLVMVAAQVLVGAYLLSGFFLGHLFRDQFDLLSAEVVAAAAQKPGEPEPAAGAAIARATYRGGKRVAGDPTAPPDWPPWLALETNRFLASGAGGALPFLVANAAGAPTLAAAFGDAEQGTLAFVSGDLGLLLSERAGVWIEIAGARDPDQRNVATVTIGSNEWVLKPLQRSARPEVADAFYQRLGENPPFLVIGIDTAGQLYDLASGERIAEDVSTTVFAPPGSIASSLLSSSSEIDTLGWIAFVVPGFLLFDVYAIATAMAIVLILGLSRAVNRLSSATAAVQGGDFTVRIPVKRRDQVGALQHSFNAMTDNLENLVGQAARKELLEKELQIAHQVQKSLLPEAVPHGGAIEVATFFEPSAAIGGDYYDLLPMPGERSRLALIIADVSGHGVAAGLRMAMLKAALEILVGEGKEGDAILHALDGLIRGRQDSGVFVTATLALLDVDAGEVEIINAGHPPTYWLRGGGEVEEIMLPSCPLGALGRSYGRRTIELAKDDVLVWVSDGLIEATDHDGDAFGYERTLGALRETGSSADQARDRLIEAVRAWSPRPIAEDDQTLVALRYLNDPIRAAAEPAA